MHMSRLPTKGLELLFVWSNAGSQGGHRHREAAAPGGARLQQLGGARGACEGLSGERECNILMLHES